MSSLNSLKKKILIPENSEKQFQSKNHGDFCSKKSSCFLFLFLRNQKHSIPTKKISKAFDFHSITQSHEKQKLFSYFLDLTFTTFFNDFLKKSFDKKKVKKSHRSKKKSFFSDSTHPLLQSKFLMNSFLFSSVESFSCSVFFKRRLEIRRDFFETNSFKETFFKLVKSEILKKNGLQGFSKQFQLETNSSFFYFQFFEFKTKFYKSIRQSKFKNLGRKFQKFVLKSQTLKCFLSSRFLRGFFVLQMFLSFEKSEQKQNDSFLKPSFILHFLKKQFYSFYVLFLQNLRFLRNKNVNLAHFVYKHFSHFFSTNRRLKLKNWPFLFNSDRFKTGFYSPLFFGFQTNKAFDFQRNIRQNLNQNDFQNWNFTKKHFFYLNQNQLQLENFKTKFYRSFFKFLNFKSLNGFQIQNNQQNSFFSLKKTQTLFSNSFDIQPFFFHFFVLEAFFSFNKAKIKNIVHFFTNTGFLKKSLSKSKLRNLKLYWRTEKTSKKPSFLPLENLRALEIRLNSKTWKIRFEKTKVFTKTKISQNYFRFLNLSFFFSNQLSLNCVFLLNRNSFEFLKAWLCSNFTFFVPSEFSDSKKFFAGNFGESQNPKFLRSLILRDIQISSCFCTNSFYYFDDCFLKRWFENSLFLTLPGWNETEHYLRNLKQLMKSFSSQKQEKLIQKLTPKIFVWMFVNQKKVHCLYLRYLDQKTNVFLWQWACRRHQKKSKEWIQKKYFQKFRQTRWLFACVSLGTIDKKNFESTGERKSVFSFPKNQRYFLYLPLHQQVFFYLQKKEFSKF